MTAKPRQPTPAQNTMAAVPATMRSVTSAVPFEGAGHVGVCDPHAEQDDPCADPRAHHASVAMQSARREDGEEHDQRQVDEGDQSRRPPEHAELRRPEGHKQEEPAEDEEAGQAPPRVAGRAPAQPGKQRQHEPAEVGAGEAHRVAAEHRDVGRWVGVLRPRRSLKLTARNSSLTIAELARKPYADVKRNGRYTTTTISRTPKPMPTSHQIARARRVAIASIAIARKTTASVRTPYGLPVDGTR